jgi:hypothetical protein
VIPESFEVRLQLPITLPTSEPEPDAIVARGPEERYAEYHPGSDDVALLIEVSDLTLAMDQGPKKLLYAAAKVPIYWIINIPDGRIEVYTNPRGGRNPTYRTRTDFKRGSKTPLILNGKTITDIPVNDLLP